MTTHECYKKMRENELLRRGALMSSGEENVNRQEKERGELNGGWKLPDASCEDETISTVNSSTELLSLDGSVEEKKDENIEEK
eukprot:CAMPEP_0172479894 /NCGR_PEP_ID=MMETSP1066-20121228/4702_1 /TAXON_ID=671091 /ORGANISM="Coscinodiscus wailesii, Strain CCMP2513" /LENGTH=82 /DNA_ID=CAMNT_0013240721 /DNA_START=14 /DNA_END=259 /DNA_ORIENTATION=-